MGLKPAFITGIDFIKAMRSLIDGTVNPSLQSALFRATTRTDWSIGRQTGSVFVSKMSKLLPLRIQSPNLMLSTMTIPIHQAASMASSLSRRRLRHQSSYGGDTAYGSSVR